MDSITPRSKRCFRRPIRLGEWMTAADLNRPLRLACPLYRIDWVCFLSVCKADGSLPFLRRCATPTWTGDSATKSFSTIMELKEPLAGQDIRLAL